MPAIFFDAQLFGHEEGLEAGIHSCDVTLGANPAGRVWVTGLGSAPIKNPTLVPVNGVDGVDVPAGYTVDGPCAEARACPDGDSSVASVFEGFSPNVEAWPPALRYVDAPNVSVLNGISVARNLGPTLFAFGYLAKLGQSFDPGGRPVSMGGQRADRPDVVMPMVGGVQATPVGGQQATGGEAGPETDSGRPDIGQGGMGPVGGM